MVKAILTIFLSINLFANSCLKCHKEYDTSLAPNLHTVYFRYLLKFGSHENVKKMVIEFVKNPSKQNSILPPQAINRYGLCEKSRVENDILKKSVDEIFDRYKVTFKP